MEKISTKQFNIVISLFLIGLMANTSCNDSSIIGSDIIGADQVNVEVKEIAVKATTVLVDSVQTYRATNQLDNYVCGFMEDPLFGSYESIFNTQLRLSRFLGAQDSLDIKNLATGADSAFLVIELSSGFYGQISDQQLVEVHLLGEPMDNNETYASNRSFLKGDFLGSKMFTPSNPDTTIFYVGGTSEIPDTIIPPQIRIPLNVNHPIFRDILFAGESSLQYFADDAALLGILNGIQVSVPNSSSPEKGLMLFDPVPPSPSTPSVTGLYVHFTSFNTDLGPRLFTFSINENAAKMVNFVSDNYAGTDIDSFIGENNYATGDSLFFIHGMSGLNAKLEIQDVSSLADVIINKAELEFTVATDLMGDDTLFSNNPIPQLLIATKNAEGELEAILDVEAAIAGGQISIFGGTVENDSNNSNSPLYKYRMNITGYIQELINGDHSTKEIFVYPALRAERPQRVAIFGPGHSQHPVKLYVTYTENQ